MNHNFMTYVIGVTFAMAFAAFFATTYYWDLSEGAGVFLGACWGVLNFYLIKKSLQEWLTVVPRNYWRLYVYLQFKFPILYLAGYGLLRLKFFSALSFLIGFSFLFASIFLLGIVKMILDKRQLEEGPAL